MRTPPALVTRPERGEFFIWNCFLANENDMLYHRNDNPALPNEITIDENNTLEERRGLLVIEYYDISESELQNLLELENKYSDNAILVVTKDAFDGETMAELILGTLSILAPVLEIIKLWKENRSKRKVTCEKSGVDNVAVGKGKVIFKFPNGSYFEMEIENMNLDAFKAFLNLNGDGELGSEV